MDSFIINAIICGLGVALISGLLGCFVAWKKMSYFGDSLSHSTILGAAIGIAFGANQDFSIILVVMAFALLLTYMQHKNIFSNDAILGILAHGALSAGIVIISLTDNSTFNLHAFLFGDLLSISQNEIYFIFIAAIIIYFIILSNWKSLILSTISRDLARSQNISNFKMDLLLTTVMALAIASSIQITGALLITSLLIIPSSSARQLVTSPKSMVIISTIISTISVLVGILLSYKLDTPPGATIILTSFILFLMVITIKRI